MHRLLILSSLAISTSVHADDVITFARDSVQIDREERKRIDSIARAQAKNRDSILIIEGHASDLGISQRRTDAVRRILVQAGADPNRLVLVAYDDRDQGRRVVIRSTASYPELAREQVDPETGEDARAAARDTDEAAAPPPAPPPSPTTVVVVPGTPSAPQGAPSEPTNWGAGVPDRTSGGAGDSALTGTGMEPTAEDSAPDPDARGPTIFGLPRENAP